MRTQRKDMNVAIVTSGPRNGRSLEAGVAQLGVGISLKVGRMLCNHESNHSLISGRRGRKQFDVGAV